MKLIHDHPGGLRTDAALYPSKKAGQKIAIAEDQQTQTVYPHQRQGILKWFEQLMDGVLLESFMEDAEPLSQLD